ncbi:MAG TPA: hypothetical protein VKA30_01310, partial [Actinomycetota bacterium]|nr:hypothetical protein [Actinomycetota bacterium]
VRSPVEVTRDLLAQAGLAVGTTDLGYIDGRRVALGLNHTVEGNPMRLSRGDLEVRSDEAWRRNMPRGDRWLVTGLTLPLLRKYGYATGRGHEEAGRR